MQSSRPVESCNGRSTANKLCRYHQVISFRNGLTLKTWSTVSMFSKPYRHFPEEVFSVLELRLSPWSCELSWVYPGFQERATLSGQEPCRGPWQRRRR